MSRDPSPTTRLSTYRPPPDMPPALFTLGGSERVHATELARGPWAHRVMHGGPICGVLGWAVESALGRSDLVCSRLTVDILSGVPVAELDVTTEVVKSGKRTALVDAALYSEGRMVARASSQWLLGTPPQAVGTASPADLPPVRADPAAHPDMEYPRPGFNADAVDLRVISGSTEEPGPGRIWIRLDHDLIEGQPATAFQQVTTLGDLGAAVGWQEAPSGAAFINTDVTIQLLRRPVDPWFLFEAGLELGTEGIACCRTRLSDVAGPLGWVLQSSVEAPPEISF